MPPGKVPSNVRRDKFGRFRRAKRRSSISAYFRKMALRANRGRSKDEMRSRYYANGLHEFQYKKRQPVIEPNSPPGIELPEHVRENAELLRKLHG